jgi:2,4-dienoyl-CoA reductase (NADPH2)
VWENFDGLISSGRYVFRNYLLYRTPGIRTLMQRRWETDGERVEGALLPDARAIRRAVSIPVLCTGGFQTASVARAALEAGDCDAVTLARTLVANRDLVELWLRGEDRPPRPCSYCNRCLFNLLEHPLGCYDERRYASREEMLEEVYAVFDPPPFTGAAGAGRATASAGADR